MGNQLYGMTQRGCECGTRYDQEDEEAPKGGNSSIRDWESMDDSQQRMVFERVRDKMNQLKLDTVELRHERSAPLQVFVSCGTGFNMTNQLVVTGYVAAEQAAALQKLRDMVKQQCNDAVFSATSPCEGEEMPHLEAVSPYDNSVTDIFGGGSLGKVVCCWFWTEGLLQQYMCRRFAAIAVRCREEWGRDVKLFEVNLIGAAPRGLSPAEGERVLQLQLPDRASHEAAGLTEPCVIITNAKGRIMRRCGLKEADIEEDIKRILHNTPLAPHDTTYDRRWESLPPDKREANMAELGEALDRFSLPQGYLQITEHRVRGYSASRHEGDFMERYLTGVSRARDGHAAVCDAIRLHLPGIELLDLEESPATFPFSNARDPRPDPAQRPGLEAHDLEASTPPPQRVFRPSPVEGWPAEHPLPSLESAYGLPSTPGAVTGAQYTSIHQSQEQEEAAIKAQAESDIQAMISSLSSPTPNRPSDIPKPPLGETPPPVATIEQVVTTPGRQPTSPFQPKQIVPPLSDRPGKAAVPPLQLGGFDRRFEQEARDPQIVREAMGRRQLDSMHDVSRDAVVATKRGQHTWVSPSKEGVSQSPARPEAEEAERPFTDNVLAQVLLPEHGDVVDEGKPVADL